MTERETELKPCPFCGGEARLMKSTECAGHGDYIHVHYVECEKCKAKGKTTQLRKAVRVMAEYIERVPFAGLIEHLDKKEPCKNCYHRAACDAWVRNATTLYDDYLYSVENCPYYKPTADVVHRVEIAKEIFEEIERRLPNEFPFLGTAVAVYLEELKKKYTEKGTNND